MTKPAPEKPPSRFKRYVTKIARQQNLAMFETLKRSDPSRLRPQLTFGRLLAYLYASIYYLIALTIILGTAYYVVYFRFVVCMSVIGLVELLVIWVMRPKFGKFPEKYFTRVDVPTLYTFTDKIVQEFHIKRVDGIVFNEDFNAGFARVGLQRKTLLVIGLPLWNALSDSEKVALLAHELAHGANGDSGRAFFVRSVCDSLINWAKIFYPQRTRHVIFLDLVYAPVLLSMLWLSRLALWNARLLYYLLSWESRRAEYLADYLASTMAGTEATRSMLGKLYFAKALPQAQRRAMRSNVRFDAAAFYEEVRNTPLGDLERINEPDPEEIARLDLSHPPIGYRMRLLAAKAVDFPQLQLPTKLSEDINREISAALRKHDHVHYDDEAFWKNLPKKNGFGKQK